jgi:hypothetical protein
MISLHSNMFLTDLKKIMEMTCEQVYHKLWILLIRLARSPSFTAAALAKKFNAAINICLERNDHPHLRVSRSILFLFL